MAKELSEEKILGSKFTLSLQTIIAGTMGLPTLESLYESEYPSKPQGYNHPASYEQYKSQVGALQENQDDIYDIIEELQDEIKELNKQITNLRIAVQ